MRTLYASICCFTALCFATHTASAQEQNIIERYESAVITIVGEPKSPREHRQKILDNLAGDWFNIASVMPETNDVKLFKNVCRTRGIKVSVLNEFQFDATIGVQTPNPVRTIYTSRSGIEFGTYTDVVMQLKRFGVEPGDESMVALTNTENILKSVNGSARLVRPYDDILVVLPAGNPYQVWARCPE